MTTETTTETTTTAPTSSPTAERWEIDASHSGVHFSVRHMVVAKVRGHFARWSGHILAPQGQLELGSVEVVVDTSSIETGVADRDTHLNSADFLDVARFPEMTFRSTRVERRSEDRLRVLGELTLHGVTKEIALDVSSAGQAKDPWGNLRAGFSARAQLERKDFGLHWNQFLEAGGVLVGDRIDIDLEIEAVRQAAAKAA